MKLKDIVDVMSFKAFLPEPDDGTTTWHRRFPKEKTLLLNIGRRRVSWASLNRRGEFVELGSIEGELKEVLGTMAPEWSAMTENGWCAVSLNTRCMLNLEINLSRRPGLEEMLKSNPKGVLGSKAERGKRYGLKHNPESNSSILVACDEDAIVKTEALLKEANFKVGRFSCGVYGMLLDLLAQYHEIRTSRDAKSEGEMGPVLLIACCEGSVAALTVKDEAWLELRSRTDCYSEDMSPVMEIILPLLQNAGAGTQVIYMADTDGTIFPAMLQNRAPGLPVSDVSVPTQLWKILTDL
jgi:hypothetical protein